MADVNESTLDIRSCVPPEWVGKYRTVCLRVYSTNIPILDTGRLDEIAKVWEVIRSISQSQMSLQIMSEISLNGFPLIDVDRFYVNGVANIHFQAKDSPQIRGHNIAIVAPAVDGADGVINEACDIARSLLSLFFGPAAAIDLKISIYLDIDGDQIHVSSEAIENHFPVQITAFGIDGLPIEVVDEFRPQIIGGLQLLARAISEVESSIKFSLYWMAIEAICGGLKERKLFFDFLRDKISWVAVILREFKESRNDLFHEGKKAKFDRDDETCMRFIVQCAIRWRIGLPIQTDIDLSRHLAEKEIGN